MARSSRQNKILELISRHDIDTQEELQDRLRDCGIHVTQATISRDIKELGIVKVLLDGKYRYSLDKSPVASVSIKMSNMFRESVISIDYAGNLVVVKTLPGSANSAGVLIDNLELNGALCCISGDDAVLIVMRTPSDVEEAISKLNEILV